MVNSFRQMGAIIFRIFLRRSLGGMLAVAVAAVLAGCGALPQRSVTPMAAALDTSPDTALAKIVAASTPPGEHSGFRLMP
ncbi:MAG: hypothetical protein ABW200_12625, partial [Hyphomicrobiaceae bacterium]